MTLTLTVVVPTYRRPLDLQRCLDALVAQDRPPDEVVVVVKAHDPASGLIVDAYPAPVRKVVTSHLSFLDALWAGAAAAVGDVVAFTDDDAAALPDWSARLLDHYRDVGVGGVGGRDLIVGDEDPPAVAVGMVNRWGRLVGNHHRGTGLPRRVDVLKGVNMSYRREALALPVGFRGKGTTTHTEVAIGLWATAQGWALVYDPDLLVRHWCAPRSDDHGRNSYAPRAMKDSAYNFVAGVGTSRPDQLWRLALYGLVVGNRGLPGVARAAISLLQGRVWEALAVAPSLSGQLAALRDLLGGRPVVLRPVAGLEDRSLDLTPPAVR